MLPLSGAILEPGSGRVTGSVRGRCARILWGWLGAVAGHLDHHLSMWRTTLGLRCTVRLYEFVLRRPSPKIKASPAAGS